MNIQLQGCIITGCALHVEGDPRYAWGDLFKFESIYIFNASIDAYSRIMWQQDLPPPNFKVIRVHLNANYFERRGVFAIWEGVATLNDAAKAYLSLEGT